MTLQQFAELHPAFPVSSLQWMRQRSMREIVRTNREGRIEVLRRLPQFDGCFGKVGTKLLVNAPKLHSVLTAAALPPAAQQPEPAPAPAAAAPPASTRRRTRRAA